MALYREYMFVRNSDSTRVVCYLHKLPTLSKTGAEAVLGFVLGQDISISLPKSMRITLKICICINLVWPAVAIAVMFAVLRASSRTGDEADLFSILLHDLNIAECAHSVYTKTVHTCKCPDPPPRRQIL